VQLGLLRHLAGILREAVVAGVAAQTLAPLPLEAAASAATTPRGTPAPAVPSHRVLGQAAAGLLGSSQLSSLGAVAVLELAAELLPQACEPASHEAAALCDALLPAAGACLTSGSHALRLAAVVMMRVIVRLRPAALAPALRACVARLTEAAAQATSAGALAGVAASSAAGALAGMPGHMSSPLHA